MLEGAVCGCECEVKGGINSNFFGEIHTDCYKVVVNINDGEEKMGNYMVG